MRILFLFPLAFMLTVSCNNTKEIQSIETTDSKPEVVVETSAAIVGGLDALHSVLKYPEKAKRENVETVLQANVLVSKRGHVEQISFENETETDYGFEEAAREALHKVEFRAGERNGEPINMFINIPVKFEL